MKSSFPFALALFASLVTVSLAKAEMIADIGISLPVPVQAYSAAENATMVEENEMTVEDVKQYLKEKNSFLQNGLGRRFAPDFQEYRIDGFTLGNQQILIRVHKSTTLSKPEYLEVFKANFDSSMEALNLFDNGASNRALVSTAGTFSGKQYDTPAGNYKIDSLEVMHYSKAYDNAPMPWSIFFNDGIAIHAATGSEISHLGRPASHGCVRTHPRTAKILFAYIKQLHSKNVVVQILEE